MGNVPPQVHDVAHVLRRTSFGPFPGGALDAVDRHGDAATLVEAQLSAPPLPFRAPMDLDRPTDPAAPVALTDVLVQGWITRMLDPDAGLHEKMMWFWHTVLTTSTSKSDGPNCWRQLRLLHRHALGNFGDLVREISTDGAMLQWLDGGLSRAPEPNENYARELLELFTLGRGNYTEADVRTAAMAMAGWEVERGAPRPVFVDVAPHPPGEFLGRTASFTPATVVDRILEQPAVAPFIVGKLAAFLVGGEVPLPTLAAWADGFRASGYEIRPLVASVLRSPEFMAARWARARSGIEWVCGSVAAGRLDINGIANVRDFAQVPFWPLNVAGWPDRWLTTSSLFARAGFLAEQPFHWSPQGRGDRVAAAFERCNLFEVSDPTRAAVARVVAESPDDRARHLRAVLMSPEFAVA